MPATMSLTAQLRLYSGGAREVGDSLFREIFPRLRKVAARKLAKERVAPPLTPTELVGETWLTNLRRGNWKIEDREHFFHIAGRAMENVITDMARKRLAQIRGSGAFHTSIDEIPLRSQPTTANAEQVVAVSLLLDQLSRSDAKVASIVRLHYVVGYSLEEIAQGTGLSLRQVRYRWEKGKTWLTWRLLAPGCSRVRA